MRDQTTTRPSAIAGPRVAASARGPGRSPSNTSSISCDVIASSTASRAASSAISAYWSRSRYSAALARRQPHRPVRSLDLDRTGELEESGDRLDVDGDGAVDLRAAGRRVELGDHFGDAREVGGHGDVRPEVDGDRFAVDAGAEAPVAGEVVGRAVEHGRGGAHRAGQVAGLAGADDLESAVVGAQLGPRAHEPAQPAGLGRSGEGDEVRARAVATEHRRRQPHGRQGAVGLLDELVDVVGRAHRGGRRAAPPATASERRRAQPPAAGARRWCRRTAAPAPRWRRGR